jgi:GNAT superfamily N-acetyltransferase
MDMLIKLYAASAADAGALRNAVLRKPIGPEHSIVTSWVARHFGAGWASEAQVALQNRPVSVWLATNAAELLGFACYDATARGFFGPIGVAESARSQGLGAALLRACLQDMRAAGYGYAIAGAVGVPEFFRRCAGAIEIADSSPGLYAHRLAD